MPASSLLSWMLRLLPPLLVATAWPAAAFAQELAPAPKLELLYTGMTGGLSSGSVEFAELLPLMQGEPARDFEVTAFGQDNVFRHEAFYLYTADGPLTLEDFKGFFDAGPVELKRIGPMPLVASDYAYVWQPDGRQDTWLLDWLSGALQASGKYPDARAAQGTRFEVTNRQGLTLSLISLSGEAPTQELLEAPSQWEMLPARAAIARRDRQPTGVLAVARPLGDGLRRAALLDQLRSGHRDGVLTVDLGNLLDPGFSALSRQQREFTFLQLGTLRYDAMVPAETELTLPATDWQRLSALVPMVAANLKPNDPALPALPPYVIKSVGGLKVALVGAVDDQVLAREGASGPGAAWTATDPVAAVADAMAKVAIEKPDVTFLLTNVRDDRLSRFRNQAGVTAILADFQGLPGEHFTETATLSGINRLRVATPYMIAHSSRNRVGRITVDFDAPDGRAPSLSRLTNEALLVTDRLPYDPAWRWQLNLTLGRYQAERRALLLPDLREALAGCPSFKPAEQDSALPRIEWHLWSRMVANVLRDATGAEVAISRVVPMRDLTMGPINQLTMEGWLEMGDRLVQTTLSGKAIKGLAAQDQTTKLLSFSGYDPATQKINGYALNDDELYLVTTTDQVVRNALYQDAFAKRPTRERWLRQPDGRVAPYAEGERTELRDTVLAYFKALKGAHGGAFDAAYMQDYSRLLAAGDQVTAPRWTIALDDGQLLLNSYQNTNNQPFSQVRNTRVNTPSSFALGGKGKLSVVYDAPALAWENRAKSIYRRATLQQNGVQVTQETDDEIVFTSEARLKALQIPLPATPFALLPYVNSNFTTEFTPGNANGTEKPRRAELNGIAGLILNPGFGLKEIRMGAVLKNDLANPGNLEPGVQAIASFERKLSDVWPATLQAGLDVTHYFNTPYDKPDRLGLLADFTGALTIPLWDHFNFTLSADYFMFRGKVPETNVLGTSLDFKVGLGYSLAFKPFYGVWF